MCAIGRLEPQTLWDGLNFDAFAAIYISLSQDYEKVLDVTLSTVCAVLVLRFIANDD